MHHKRHKDFTIGIGTFFASLLVLASFFSHSIRQATSDIDAAFFGNPNAMFVLHMGDHSSITTRVNYLITSPEELSLLWSMLNLGTTTPSVDFTQESVIAVFAGEKSSGGHGIRVMSVRDVAVRTVSVVLTEPGEGCMVTEEVTTPYEVLMVRKTSLPYTHTDTTETVAC